MDFKRIFSLWPNLGIKNFYIFSFCAFKMEISEDADVTCHHLSCESFNWVESTHWQKTKINFLQKPKLQSENARTTEKKTKMENQKAIFLILVMKFNLRTMLNWGKPPNRLVSLKSTAKLKYKTRSTLIRAKLIWKPPRCRKNVIWVKELHGFTVFFCRDKFCLSRKF